MHDFKINDYVCRTVGGVQYVGRVRKKEEDDKGLRIWVQFTPPVEGRGVDRPYIEFEPHELEPVAICVSPPTAKKPDPFDPFDNPIPKTER